MAGSTSQAVAQMAARQAAEGAREGGAAEPGPALAFFYAGARSLLASHWPVRDDVAAEITVDAIRRKNASGGKISRAEALQAAMRQIRMSPGDPSRAHPSAWAPFSLVGDNSARAR